MYPEQYLSDAFTYILNMSITGSYIILAVLLVRLFIKKAPKKISCLLWVAPFVRLAVPFAPRSPFSFFNLNIFNRDVYSGNVHEYVPLSYDWDYTPEFATGITQGQSIIPSTFEAFTGAPDYSANPLQIYLFILACVWLLGISAMLTYAAVTFIKAKKKLSTAARLEGNIFESENISSPFVMGIIRPKIYLPYGLTEKEKKYIILHEKTHIKNLDHFSKVFAFLVLTVHWFNPLCYLAFTLMSRDMEMACDETVLNSNKDIRKDYSSSLLSFASGKRLPSPSPLCFGESGVKQRIKNALSWKKPKVWIIAVGLVILFCSTVAFISNPATGIKFGSINDTLDEAISYMFLDEVAPPYFCPTEGHKIFGYSQKDEEITVYGVYSYTAMNFVNGCLTDSGNGGAGPFVAVFRDKDGIYKLKELKYPQDGMGYGDSIRAMFPSEFERNALNHYKYMDEMRKQQHAQAEYALEEAGIHCEVVDYRDINIALLSDGIDEKLSNSGTISTAGYPSHLGVEMYIQGGRQIVYEKRAEVEKGRYYLAQYENGSSEAVAHAFDKDGIYLGNEKITVKNFFDYEMPREDTELYYIFDESKLTTHAIILEEGETLPTDGTPPEPTTRIINSQTKEAF